MTVASMLWWSEAQLECVRSPLQHAFNQWLSHWVVRTGKTESTMRIGVVLHNAHESPDGIYDSKWIWVGGDEGASTWLDHSGPLTQTVALTLFGDPCHRAPIALGIVKSALDDLRHALVDALKLRSTAHEPQEKPSARWVHPWSGHVLASMSCSNATIRMLIGFDCVVSLVKAGGEVQPSRTERPDMTQLTQALAGHAVQMRAGFSPFEIDVGSLLSLGINDILQLPHSLDAPLLMSSDTLGELCGGYLGQSEGHFSVELIGSV